MVKLAGEKLCVKRKPYELHELVDKKDPNSHTVTFGKYAGQVLCPAELIFLDTQYFYWALTTNAFEAWCWYDAWNISQRASHIRPPTSRPDSYRFDMAFNKTGEFESYDIVKSSSPLKTNLGILRVKHLDMSLVSYGKYEEEGPAWKLTELMACDFFRDRKMTAWDYQEFFEEEYRFDLRCREHHCPRIPRLLPKARGMLRK